MTKFNIVETATGNVVFTYEGRGAKNHAAKRLSKLSADRYNMEEADAWVADATDPTGEKQDAKLFAK